MEETKKCPHCGGEILAVAKKCKHCGRWLEPKDVTNAPFTNSANTNAPAEQKRSGAKLFLPVLVIVIIGIILIIAIQIIFSGGEKAVAMPDDSVSTYENIDQTPQPSVDETDENSSNFDDFVIN